MRPEEEDEFRQYVAGRLADLRRFAYLCCGDWHRAEDATQTAFTKLYVSWRRISRMEAPDAYVRRMVVNALNGVHRHGWFRREHTTGEAFPERPSPGGVEPAADRVTMLAALARLSPRRRATLVLRFWEDRSVEETAHVMGCSPSTVKAHTAKGLAMMRVLLAEPETTERRSTR